MLGPRPTRHSFSAAGPRHGRICCRGAAGQAAPSVSLHVLPLPGVVALPHANLPITLPPASEHQAFFRSLTMQPGLEGSEASQHSHRAQFGACQAQNTNGGINISPVGTLMEVTDLKQLPDGSMRVVARGQQRFQVTAAEGEGSLLRCTVQLLKEEASPKEAPKAMRVAGEVLSLLPNYLRVYVRSRAQEGGPELPAFVASLGPGLTRSALQAWISGEADNPELEARIMCNLGHMQPEELDLYAMRPAEVSYFVASLFTSMPELQQHLLQEDSTLSRLRIERELLQSS